MRARGDGSVYPTADGRWRWAVVVGYTYRDGVRRPTRRYGSAATKAAAQAGVRKALRERDDGTLTAGRASTDAWFRYWLDEVCTGPPRPLKRRTLTDYRSRWVNWIRPHLPARLDEITPRDLRRLYAAMHAAGCAPSHVLKTHRVIARALKVAVREGRLARSPADMIDAPAAPPVEVPPLTAEEIRAVMPVLLAHPRGVRYVLALALGPRQGEALALAWDDLDGDVLTVRCQLEAVPRAEGGGFVPAPVKTAAGERTVRVPAPIMTLLDAHRAATAPYRASDTWVGWHRDLIFHNRVGRPIQPRRDYADWIAILDKAGVRRVPLHAARHTSATTLLEQGVDVRVVQAILGHSDPAFTRRRYQHATDRLLGDAASAIADALFSDEVPQVRRTR